MRQAPSARAAWPSCTGLASARRTTGAEWKRMPIVKPLASAWCGRLGGQDRRRRVVRRDAGRVAARLHEIGLKLCGIDAAEFRAALDPSAVSAMIFDHSLSKSMRPWAIAWRSTV